LTAAGVLSFKFKVQYIVGCEPWWLRFFNGALRKNLRKIAVLEYYESCGVSVMNVSNACQAASVIEILDRVVGRSKSTGKVKFSHLEKLLKVRNFSGQFSYPEFVAVEGGIRKLKQILSEQSCKSIKVFESKSRALEHVILAASQKMSPQALRECMGRPQVFGTTIEGFYKLLEVAETYLWRKAAEGQAGSALNLADTQEILEKKDEFLSVSFNASGFIKYTPLQMKGEKLMNRLESDPEIKKLISELPLYM
jgi:hypothetical protein